MGTIKNFGKIFVYLRLDEVTLTFLSSNTMKAIVLTGILAMGLGFTSQAQFDLKKLAGEVNKAVGNNKPGLSNDEVIKGLKEALTIGSKNSSDLASKVGGYYNNPSIKIPFPPEAKDMEQTLRNLGMGKQVDEFITTLNRAAEDAAKKSAPIFADAVRNMSITDGINILKGGDNAATNYLKQATTAQLEMQFKPVVRESIDRVKLTKYWKPLATKYNKLPMVKKVNPDLEGYITQKAIEGLFFLVAQEEYKIRKDPLARVTELLKKVFGS